MQKLQDPLGESIDFDQVPKHIAIIMDGNRRWATLHNKEPIEGHFKGAENLSKIVRFASDLGVRFLTVYSFSTENWQRSKNEVKALMELIKHYLINERDNMVKEGVCLEGIGDLSSLPSDVQEIFYKTRELTKAGTKITLTLALNYGGRDELVRSMRKILVDYEMNKFTKDEVTEELVGQYLDTKNILDPDLLIRTSGEMRISNFLLWQLSYSEIFVTKTLWPDFSEKNLLEAIYNYQTRLRRLGE